RRGVGGHRAGAVGRSKLGSHDPRWRSPAAGGLSGSARRPHLLLPRRVFKTSLVTRPPVSMKRLARPAIGGRPVELTGTRTGPREQESAGEQGTDRRDRPEEPSLQPFPSRYVAGTRRLLRDRPRRVLADLRGGSRAGARVLRGMPDSGDLPRLGAQERRAVRGLGWPDRAAAAPPRA